jgi:hypothetical protein
MKNRLPLLFLMVAFFPILIVHNACTKKDNPPSASLKVFPSVGPPETQFEFDAGGCQDEETTLAELLIRLDWESDGTWDLDWSSDKNQSHQYAQEGDYSVNMEVMDGNGGSNYASGSLKVTNSDQLIPISTPFTYNVGINYESWTAGRGNRVIADDLDTISKYFRLIKTFHCEAVGTTQVLMDPTQQEVIDYILAHPEKSLELALGTSNAVLASGGFGTPWVAGLMTTRTYTDQWVQMLISSFQNIENVKKYVRVILLGNEVDANGPPTSESLFTTYYTQWIPQAFNNLKASLSDAGLGQIPVTTIIANYPLGDANSNIVASSVTTFVKGNWSASWNGGNSFVLFNQYTPDWGKSADFGPVISYFESVYTKISGSPGIYVGETGYSSEYTLDNEVKVVKQIFNWLESQHKINGLTIPLFVFQAYDYPDKPAGQQDMGLFKDDSQNKPQGLKQNILVPGWVSQPK